MRKKTKGFVISFAVTGLILVGSLFGLEKYCALEANEPHSYTLTSNILDEPGSGTVSTSVEFSKKWEDTKQHASAPYGAQYDFVVRNTTDHIIYNWTADYTFPDEITEDSTWNGDYKYDGNHLIFTPNEDIYKMSSQHLTTYSNIFWSSYATFRQ